MLVGVIKIRKHSKVCPCFILLVTSLHFCSRYTDLLKLFDTYCLPSYRVMNLLRFRLSSDTRLLALLGCQWVSFAPKSSGSQALASPAWFWKVKLIILYRFWDWAATSGESWNLPVSAHERAQQHSFIHLGNNARNGSLAEPEQAPWLMAPAWVKMIYPSLQLSAHVCYCPAIQSCIACVLTNPCFPHCIIFKMYSHNFFYELSIIV